MGEPSVTAVKTLFALSRNLCFFTGYEERLTDPQWWHRVNGEVAHIRGEHLGSARYDQTQTEQERQGFGNLMLLCPKHHKLVDWLQPDAFSSDLLTEMKERHLAHGTAQEWISETAASEFAEQAIAFSGLSMQPSSAFPPGLERQALRSTLLEQPTLLGNTGAEVRARSEQGGGSQGATNVIADERVMTALEKGLIAQGPNRAFASHALSGTHLFLHIWFESPPSESLVVEFAREDDAAVTGRQHVPTPARGVTQTTSFTRPPAGNYRATWLVEASDSALLPVATMGFEVP